MQKGLRVQQILVLDTFFSIPVFEITYSLSYSPQNHEWSFCCFLRKVTMKSFSFKRMHHSVCEMIYLNSVYGITLFHLFAHGKDIAQGQQTIGVYTCFAVASSI